MNQQYNFSYLVINWLVVSDLCWMCQMCQICVGCVRTLNDSVKYAKTGFNSSACFDSFNNFLNQFEFQTCVYAWRIKLADNSDSDSLLVSLQTTKAWVVLGFGPGGLRAPLLLPTFGLSSLFPPIFWHN